MHRSWIWSRLRSHTVCLIWAAALNTQSDYRPSLRTRGAHRSAASSAQVRHTLLLYWPITLKNWPFLLLYYPSKRRRRIVPKARFLICAQFTVFYNRYDIFSNTSNNFSKLLTHLQHTINKTVNFMLKITHCKLNSNTNFQITIIY